MASKHQRRAAALEAIASALLELAAIEHEADEESSADTLIDRRNCEKEVGLSRSAFVEVAGRDFAAFRVSRRLTATKADVIAWLKSRTVTPKAARLAPPKPAPTPAPPDPDAFLKDAHECFVRRVGRPMTDAELDAMDMCVDAGRFLANHVGKPYADTPDEIAARMQRDFGREPSRHADWRSFGLDVAKMERDAEELRERLRNEHPKMGWRERNRAVWDMWGAITTPLYEARRLERKKKRDAKKAEREKAMQLGQKPSRAPG